MKKMRKVQAQLKLLCCILAVLAFECLALPHANAIDRWDHLADPVFQHPISTTPAPGAPVVAITQDHEGFLWIGTENGVSRWDGYSFRQYRSDPADPNSLPDNYIQSLYVDLEGTLWIATQSGGLSRYDRGQDRFINYRAGPNGLSSVDVLGITDDGAGGIWIATNHGLDEIHPARGVIRHLRHQGSDPASLPDDRVGAVLRDREGHVFIGTESGLVRQDAPAGALEEVPLPGLSGKNPSIDCLHEDESGRIWVGTKFGAYVIEPGPNGRNSAPQAVPGSAAESIESMVEGRSGDIWLGTYGDGILVVDKAARAVVRHIRNDPLLPQSLDENTLWSMYRDRAGDIWVGTNRGLSRYDPNQPAILSIFGVVSRKTGISDGDVESVLSMPDGRLWLGLGSRGLDILDPSSGRSGSVRKGIDLSGKAIDLSEVRDLVSTPKGEVFLCSRTGLYRKGPSDPLPVRIPLPGGLSTRALAVSPETGTLWFGSLDDGLWSIKLHVPGNAAAQRYPGSSQLTDPRISVLSIDTPGSIWIGTFNGLNHLNLASGSVERIRADPKATDTIAAPYVTALMTDRQGRLWVGMQGGGISILDSRAPDGRPHFRHLGLAEGLPNLNIDKILQAPSGDVWVATDDGLAVVDPAHFSVRALKQAEGAFISSYWINAGAAIPGGLLAFGGSGGLTLVRPDLLKDNDDRPPIAVTSVVVGGKALPWGRFGKDGSSAPIVIPADANSLAVEFSALDYSAPERNRYASWLEGYDRSWNETDAAHRVAAYTNLPPGRYVLHLRGSNRDGVWMERTLSLLVTVQTHWYQTVWFRGIELLFVFGAVIVLLHTRTSYLRMRQRELELQVASQTAELRERERQLEQMAYFDFLTGLPNRRAFLDQFNRSSALAQRQGSTFALLLIDLDQFKHINDSLGHDAGDALLIESARRLQSAVRESDYVYRLGGDEFCILLIDAGDVASVEVCCRKLTECFTAAVLFQAIEMRTSPSIGVARFPEDGQSLDELYKLADIALYEAKRGGKNTWRWGRDLSNQRR
jgi:diguanylate cyclase (GGDEF)-like protein